jgi:hypothetical protein
VTYALEELRAQVLLAVQGKRPADEVYEPLRAALAAALLEAQQAALPRREPLLELAHLMARLREVRSLALLMQVDTLGLPEPLELLLHGLVGRAHPDDFRALMAMLTLLWEKHTRLVQALKIAEALVQMAEKQPLPEHRPLLGLLREFAALRTGPTAFLELLSRLIHALGESFDAEQTCWFELEFLCRADFDRAELARIRLVAQGRDVVPQALECLQAELIWVKQQDSYQRRKAQESLHLGYTVDTLQRLTEVLADLADIRALSALLAVVRSIASVEPSVLRLIVALGTQEDPEVAAGLIAALRLLQTGPRQPRCAVALGRAVVELAERAPSEALREALPLLHSRLGAPLELYLLHQRLKALLPKRTLPRPASAPTAMEDLPIPATNKSSDAPG